MRSESYELKCEKCNCTDQIPSVQHGSYSLHCTECGAVVIVTSWIAVKEDFEGFNFELYSTFDCKGELIGKGEISTLIPLIDELANKGNSVFLKGLGKTKESN